MPMLTNKFHNDSRYTTFLKCRHQITVQQLTSEVFVI